MRVGVVKQDTVGTNGGEGGWGGGGEGLGLEREGEEVNGWVTAHKVTVWLGLPFRPSLCLHADATWLDGHQHPLCLHPMSSWTFCISSQTSVS